MFYILFGPDEFSLREELMRLKDSMGDREMLAANTTILDGRQLTPEQLMNTCNTLPFLAPRRLVIVERLLGRFEPESGRGRRKKGRGAGKSGEDEWRVLPEYTSKMPETTVLVLVDGDITAKNPLFARLNSVAEVKSFPLLKGVDLHNWIRSRVKRGNGNIVPGAVKMLADLVGGNLWVLANEIEKLLVYTSGRYIESEDVEHLVSYARDTSIFAVVDAILEQQAPRAILLLHRLLSEGTSPTYVMVMIARQLRLVVLAKELVAQGVSSREAQKRLGFSSEYPFRKTLEQARMYPVEQLESAYRRLLTADIAMKTGEWRSIRTEKWRDELILDVLIIDLCSESTLTVSVS